MNNFNQIEFFCHDIFSLVDKFLKFFVLANTYEQQYFLSARYFQVVKIAKFVFESLLLLGPAVM